MVGAAAVPPFAPSDLNPDFHESQAILWFELAHTADEVEAVLTSAKADIDMRAAMDTLNLYDFPFMVAYSLYFLAMICFVREGLREASSGFFASNVFFASGLFLIPLILAGDIIENTQLLKLTRYGTEGYPATIPFETIFNLEVFTRMKWGAIFLACAHLGASYAALALINRAGSGRSNQAAFASIAIAFFGTTLLGFVSITGLEQRSLLQLATLAMIVAWVGVLIHGGLRSRGVRGNPA